MKINGLLLCLATLAMFVSVDASAYDVRKFKESEAKKFATRLCRSKGNSNVKNFRCISRGRLCGRRGLMKKYGWDCEKSGGTGGSTPAPKSDDYYAKKYGTIAVAAYNKTKAKGCSTPGNIYGGAKHSDHYNWAKREIKSRGLSGANKKFAGEHGKRANHYKSCKPSGGNNSSACAKIKSEMKKLAKGVISKSAFKDMDWYAWKLNTARENGKKNNCK